MPVSPTALKIILRTRCGCERQLSEGAIFSPKPVDIYIPLGIRGVLSAMLVDPAGAGMPRRRFSYYEQEGDRIIFKEVETIE